MARSARSAPLNTAPFARELEKLWRASEKGKAAYLKDLGITRSTWYEIVGGTRTPNVATVTKIALAVGMDLNKAYRLCKIDVQTDPFGEELIKQWRSSGKSLGVYLNEIGINPSTWYNVVGRRARPRETTVIKLARATGIDLRKAYRLNGLDPHLAPVPASEDMA